MVRVEHVCNAISSYQSFAALSELVMVQFNEAEKEKSDNNPCT